MIGENIKRLRTTKKLGLNETAEMAGISGSYLSTIERGLRQNPSVEILEAIAKALDVSVDELFKSGIDKMSDEEVFNEIDRLTDEDRLMFRKYKALSPKDARKILEIIEIFERNNGH